MSDFAENNINIPGVDAEKGITNAGSLDLYKELLNDIYKIIDEKSNLIESYINSGEIKDYTILVHSLKTTCRMMGATDLGEDFFTLEKLGKENNLEQIVQSTPDVLAVFRSLKPYLEHFAQEDNSPKADYDKAEVTSALNNLITAIDAFDLSTAEEAARKLSSYSYSGDLQEMIKNLDKLVSNLDYDEAKELAGKILTNL